MRKPALMLQGTGSDVGKSLILAGLCRLFARRGLAVRPFKPQNMSNNAAVTLEGGEIGRAQALQARASGVPPSLHMNPVLLKPETEAGAQLVLQGRVQGRLDARAYLAEKARLLPFVLESFAILEREADLLLVEGAGSPAEINLRAHDIANMGFAEAADLPVVLIGDIDRGGVIASLVGTHALLAPAEQRRVKGFLVNKFRGDPALFEEGSSAVAERTGWPALGLVPWFAEAARLPAEDAAVLSRPPQDGRGGGIFIVVPQLSRIANFDDLDPLKLEPDVRLEIVPPGRPLPGDADLVILPGSKSTRGDLAFLKEQGWDIDLAAHRRRGGWVLGLCGGFQMLGESIFDPEGLEGPPGSLQGLGWLCVTTRMVREKRLTEVEGRHLASGEAVRGYEMHLGLSEGPGLARPLFEIAGRPEGAVSADGRVLGTYLHGAFASDGFRRAFLAALRERAHAGPAFEAEVEAVLEKLADHLQCHLDMAALERIAASRRRARRKGPAAR